MRYESTRDDRNSPLPEVRLRARTAKTGDLFGCWPFKGSLSGKGYGRMNVSGGRMYAHRFAWQLAAGPVPFGMVVGHVCDNPRCVRNDDVGTYEVRGILLPRRGHLWLGTDLQNMHDLWDKGHGFRGGAAPRGERNGSAKLTRAQVDEMRMWWATGGVLQRDLATAFGVSQAQISQIVRGKQRTHG